MAVAVANHWDQTLEISAVVPTLGSSPLLGVCLQALRDQQPRLEIVLVDQREGFNNQSLDGRLADRVVSTGSNLGFAAGTNAGIAAASGAWIATVNDDAVVAPGWASALLSALRTHPNAAAAQGVVVRHGHPDQTDSAGLAWNSKLQAIQLAHGEPPLPPTAPVRRVFGVSAAAALYRRTALNAIALHNREIFDSHLVTYYEDADLACRLRASGFQALLVPAARAEHAGSLTSDRKQLQRWRQIHGNRWLVLARILGADFPREIPALLRTDCTEVLRHLSHRDLGKALAVPAGWVSAFTLRHHFAHRGSPLLSAASLRTSHESRL